MKIVSDNFKNKARSGSRVEIAKLVIKDTGVVIDGTYLVEGFIQEMSYNDNALIGNSIAKNLEIKVLDSCVEDLGIVFNNQEVVFYTGLILDNGQEEYIKHGTFIIDSVEEDLGKHQIKLTALDYMIKFNQEFKDTLDWEDNKYTIREFATSLCDSVGLRLATETFPNSEYELSEQPAFQGYQCRYVLSKIAEIAGASAYINEEDEVEIKLYNKQGKLSIGSVPYEPEEHETYVDIRDIKGADISNFTIEGGSTQYDFSDPEERAFSKEYSYAINDLKGIQNYTSDITEWKCYNMSSYTPTTLNNTALNIEVNENNVKATVLTSSGTVMLVSNPIDYKRNVGNIGMYINNFSYTTSYTPYGIILGIEKDGSYTRIVNTAMRKNPRAVSEFYLRYDKIAFGITVATSSVGNVINFNDINILDILPTNSNLKLFPNDNRQIFEVKLLENYDDEEPVQIFTSDLQNNYLAGLDNHRDVYDFVKGKITKKIGSKVFDGSEDWELNMIDGAYVYSTPIETSQDVGLSTYALYKKAENRDYSDSNWFYYEDRKIHVVNPTDEEGNVTNTLNEFKTLIAYLYDDAGCANFEVRYVLDIEEYIYVEGSKIYITNENANYITAMVYETDDETEYVHTENLTLTYKGELREKIYLDDIIQYELYDNIYQPINAVTIALADGIEGENATQRDEESIERYGEKTLTISGNEFAINQDVRFDLVKEVFEALDGFYYTPLKIAYNSYDWLSRTDVIDVYYGDNEQDYYRSLVLNHTIEFPSTIKSTIESDMATSTNSDYEFIEEKIQRSNHTEIIVDKLNQQVKTTIEDIDGVNRSITEIIADQHKIESSVQETNRNLDTTRKDFNSLLDSQKTELSGYIKDNTTLIFQTKEEITNMITKTGGNNRIRNSVGFKGTEFWTLSEGAVVTTSQDTETEVTTTSGSKFIITNGTMRTDFTTLIGGRYTISFKIKKINQGSADTAKIELHRTENDYDTIYIGQDEITKWQEFEYSYTANVSTPYLIIDCGGDRLEITDLIANDGEKQTWSQFFDEVYGKTHKLDATGLSFTSTNSNESSHYDNNDLVFYEGNSITAQLSKDKVSSNSGEFKNSTKIGNFTYASLDSNNMILY